MSEPKTTTRIVNLWPCPFFMFWLFVLVAAILFAGKPDLMDAIIHKIMEPPPVAHQVEAPKNE